MKIMVWLARGLATSKTSRTLLAGSASMAAEFLSHAGWFYFFFRIG